MASAGDVAVSPNGVVWFGHFRIALPPSMGASGSSTSKAEGSWSVDVAPDGTVWYTDEQGVHTLDTP